jgi:iron complex transport system ATP-binding protein
VRRLVGLAAGRGAAVTGHDPRALLDLAGVGVSVEGRWLLDGVDWKVMAGQHWVVLGPNGGGKTTLVRVAGLALHPSRGRLRVLGREPGRVDIRPLRALVGTTSAALADQLRPSLSAHDVVLTARRGALEPWWHRYDDADHARAGAALAARGVGHLAGRAFGTLSSGERQRVLLARALVNRPALVLLDEPNAGLDLGGREELITALAELAAEDAAPATVLVTHHVEDIPPSATHLAALAGGRLQAAGPLDQVLDEDLLERLFGVPVTLDHRGGRWSARARA